MNDDYAAEPASEPVPFLPEEPRHVKEKETNDAGNAEGVIGSAQHEKGGGAAKQHNAKTEEDSEWAALHGKSD